MTNYHEESGVSDGKQNYIEVIISNENLRISNQLLKNNIEVNFKCMYLLNYIIHNQNKKIFLSGHDLPISQQIQYSTEEVKFYLSKLELVYNLLLQGVEASNQTDTILILATK